MITFNTDKAKKYDSYFISITLKYEISVDWKKHQKEIFLFYTIPIKNIG